MSSSSVIAELTAWANAKLSYYNEYCTNILKDIMEGEKMKFLLEKMTKEPSKRIGSLDGLTREQKVTRVDWFIASLKEKSLIPTSLVVSSHYFALHSKDHVVPVLWQLIRRDIIFLWEISPHFQYPSSLHTAILTEPFQDGPFDLSNSSASFEPFYKSELTGKLKSFRSSQRAYDVRKQETESLMIDLINAQLKVAPEGKRLRIINLEDIINSKILCCLVNSIVPGTFTTEVLLNDRWSVNLALSTAAKFFRVDCKLNTEHLNNGNDIGTCAFLTYFFLCGYQLVQAGAILTKYEELTIEQMKLQQLLKLIENEDITDPASNSKKNKSSLESEFQHVTDELTWIANSYNIEECKKWMETVTQIKNEVRQLITLQMKRRFDIITVPPSKSGMTINELCEMFVIDLSLTNGSGFYLSAMKETLFPQRKLILRDKKSGEFYDDFSGAECPTGSIRGMLGLPLNDIIEIVSYEHKDYDLFFESPSRNKILKSGSSFLYQVFPGTLVQCQRLLRLSAKRNDIVTVTKLVVFFKFDAEFVNSVDSDGNTALHIASRYGHLNIALYLLEHKGKINLQNASGCTPFFLSVEGLHKNLSQSLIEWGADIFVRNRQNKTAFEIMRNQDLKKFLEIKHSEHLELVKKVHEKDEKFVKDVISKHISGECTLSSISCRCVDGCTLLHWSVHFQSINLTTILLNEHVDVNICATNGKTPLHYAREPELVKLLLNNGAKINAVDYNGNTPLHTVCLEKDTSPYDIVEIISILLSYGSDIYMVNDNGHLPLHCAVINKHNVSALDMLYKDNIIEKKQDLLKLSINNGHLTCARWLVDKGATLEDSELILLTEPLFKEPKNKQNPLETLNFLLTIGLNVNTLFQNGSSLLHCAAGVIHIPEFIDLLIQSNADIDIIDNTTQKTPLFIACQYDNFHAASKLLEHGADCTLIDAFGKTAFDYIRDHDEWMDSGYFSDHIRARLKAYSLKYSRILVQSITDKLKSL